MLYTNTITLEKCCFDVQIIHVVYMILVMHQVVSISVFYSNYASHNIGISGNPQMSLHITIYYPVCAAT